MKRLSICILATAAVAAAVFASTGIAAASSPSSTQTVNGVVLYSPFFSTCSTTTPPPTAFPGFGSVDFKRTDPNTLSVSVHLKDAAPNSTYAVEISFGNATSCRVDADGTFNTNQNGVGSLVTTVPISPADTLFAVENVNQTNTNKQTISTPGIFIPTP